MTPTAKLIALDNLIAALHTQLAAAKTPAKVYNLENQITRAQAKKAKLIAAQYTK
jgi:hypothetical protein